MPMSWSGPPAGRSDGAALLPSAWATCSRMPGVSRHPRSSLFDRRPRSTFARANDTGGARRERAMQLVVRADVAPDGELQLFRVGYQQTTPFRADVRGTTHGVKLTGSPHPVIPVLTAGDPSRHGGADRGSATRDPRHASSSGTRLCHSERGRCHDGQDEGDDPDRDQDDDRDAETAYQPAASIWTLGAILRSTAWSPLRLCNFRFGAYAVFTFAAVSGHATQARRQVTEGQAHTVTPLSRPTRSRTPSPASACGGGCRAATSRPALGAQTWLKVACIARLCGRLRVEPT